MKRRVLHIIILTAGAVWFAAVVYLYIILSLGAVETTREDGAIAVTEIRETGGNERLAANIKRPFISGLSDLKFENEINSHIENQITVGKEAAKTAADELWKERGTGEFVPYHYTFYSDYEVKNIEGLLSLRVTTYLDTGGTGMPLTEYYNADVKNSRLLLLGDLFKDDKYKDIIYKIVKAEMEKDPERYVLEDFKAITEITKFFIYEGELYITFAKYEVASGATGEPEFRIPGEKIKEYLKDDYKVVLK